MSKRRLANWLDGHLLYVSNEEAPAQYHLWAGLSCISSALGRRVYTPWTAKGTLKPNLYIILVGSSGMRKGEAIGIAKNWMESAKVETLPDSATWEAVSAMLSDYDSYYMEEGRIRWQHGGTIIAEEVINLIGIDNMTAFGRWVEFHNAERRYRRSTKTSGEDDVDFPFLGMLGGSTPQGIRQMFPALARGGGFVSRIIFVHADAKERTVLDPTAIIRDTALHNDLIHDLGIIHRMSGAMVREKGAKKVYEAWYKEQDDLIREGKHPLLKLLRDADGWLNRKAETATKLAMVLSAAEGDGMRVARHHMEEAILLVDDVDEYLPHVFPSGGNLGKPEVAEAVATIIQANGEPITEARILRQLHMDCSHKELEIILETYRRAEMVSVRQGKRNKMEYDWIAGDGLGELGTKAG